MPPNNPASAPEVLPETLPIGVEFFHELNAAAPPEHFREQGDCLLWPGRVNSMGYGVLSVGERGARRSVFAHRYSFELANGAIPNGLCVCHHCDRPLCCNPSHLFLGTKRENLEDMQRKGRKNSPPPPLFLGENQNNAKLTETEALEILASKEPHRALARKYSVNERTIRRVRSGEGWAHIKHASQSGSALR